MVDFIYTTNGLKVAFNNLSDDTPLDHTWVWDFGDGSTSNEESPTHLYTKANFYKVTLTLYGEGGVILGKLSKRVPVSDIVKTHLSDTIYNLIDLYIPVNIFGEITSETKQQFIGKWQLYMQPLVNHNIPLEEYSNENYYEALENQLIMELAAYDFMVIKANHMIAAASVKVVEDNSSSSSSESESGQGSIKKITTGPTEVEYFDIGSEDNDTISSVTKAMQPGGILDTLKNNLCMLAERLDIYLPICREPYSTPVVPKVVNRRRSRGLDGPNPKTIVKK